MSDIAIIVEYQVKPGGLEEQERRLLATAKQCLQEDGCFRMEVFRPIGQDNTLVLSELWRDEAALEVHRSQPGHAEQHEHMDELCTGKRVLRGVVV
ncbi:MAG: putative quinol monooxygenase [Alphaproteobacteria bacterium]|jgi:quinol monooxygenase YgiN|nr:putative quinol monooxygenase [Alphaproteobacteria bacterium]MDP6830972.1 putative quinol monooxygenase [Alphaproteobacteria bacterium]